MSEIPPHSNDACKHGEDTWPCHRCNAETIATLRYQVRALVGHIEHCARQCSESGRVHAIGQAKEYVAQLAMVTGSEPHGA